MYRSTGNKQYEYQLYVFAIISQLGTVSLLSLLVRMLHWVAVQLPPQAAEEASWLQTTSLIHSANK